MTRMPLPAKLRKVENTDKKRVSIIGYTGVPVNLSDYGFPDPVVYNLGNARIKDHIPYWLEHEELMGHTVENRLTKGQVTHVAEHTVESDESDRVFQEIKNNEDYEASIDIEIDLENITFVEEGTVEVNNRVVTAPVFIANNGNISGISATKGGRDSNTSIHKLAYEEGRELLMKVKNSRLATVKNADPEKVENATTKKDGKDKGVTDTTVVTENTQTDDEPKETSKKEAKETPKKVANSTQEPVSPPEKQEAGMEYLWDYIDDPDARKLFKNARTEKWDEDRFKREVQVAKIENSYPQIPGVYIPDNKVENEFLGRLGRSLGVSHKTIVNKLGEKTADQVFDQPMMGLKEGLMLCANANEKKAVFNGHSDGERLAKHIKGLVLRNAFSTVDYPNLMHQVNQWKMDEAWEMDQPQSPQFCKEISSSNFNKHGRIKPRGGKMWENLNQEQKLSHGSFGSEDKYEVELSTVGQVVTFKREDIINDDIGWIQETLDLMIEGAMMIPDYQFTQLIYGAEAAGYLVTSGSGQSKFTLALTEANLSTVYKSVRRRFTDKGAATGTKTINGRFNTRWWLVVPSDLEETAWNIIKQDRIVNDTTANTKTGDRNYWFNRLDLMVYDNFDNATYHASAAADDWAIIPQRDTYRPFYINYLNGQRRPTSENVELPYDQLGFGVRGYWDVNLGYRPVEDDKLQAYAFSDAS